MLFYAMVQESLAALGSVAPGLNPIDVYRAVDLGLGGVLVATILGSILTGRLVPRAVLEDRIKDRDDMIAKQRQIIENDQKTIQELFTVVRDTLPATRNSAIVIAALPEPEAKPHGQ